MKQATAIIISLLLVGPVMAQSRADSLRKLLHLENNRTRKVDLALQLCETYRQGIPDSCLAYAQQAIKWLKGSKDDGQMMKAELYVASYYNNTGKPDSALAILHKNIPVLNSKPELQALLGQYHSTAGLCYMKLDQKKTALDQFYLALRAGEKTGDPTLQLKATVNIGWAMMELNQYQQAITNFSKAIALIEDNNLPGFYLPVVYNNLAASYESLEKNDSAYRYSQLAIEKAKVHNDLIAHANGLFIRGISEKKMGKLNEALQSFLDAQDLRKEVGDHFFIVSDQAELAALYAKLGRTREGIDIAQQALDTAKAYGISAKLPMIYSALADNYEAAKDYEKASAIYKKINTLKDSMYADANPKALAEMRTRYETEKHERTIEQQKNKIARQNYLVIGIIITKILLILLGLSYYKRFKLKKETQLKTEILHQQEMATKAVIEAEEQERQRIARDLHDSVGQMMSAAKMNLSAFESETTFENGEQRNNFTKILKLVDDSCHEVRQVSHNMMPNVLLKNNLGAAINDFIDKLDKKKLKVHVYTEGLEERLPSNIETVFYRVIQECVNNVIKHAGATTLDVSVIRDKDGLNATIEDNGKGFDSTGWEKFDGIGLKNILSRIEYLKGTIEFDSAPGKGTLVSLHVPASELVTNGYKVSVTGA